MRILLTDADERATLAAARSLAAAGHEVYVAAPGRFSLAGAARRVRRLRVTADPLAEPLRFAREVGEAAREIDARVILPVTDASVEALLVHRAELPESAELPLPTLGAYRLASDKLAVLPLARAAGLAVPETRVVASPDVVDLPRAECFPLVVKPHRSVVPAAGAGTARKKVAVGTVRDPDDCRRALAELPPEAYPVLLQREVRGTGVGLFLLRWQGRIIAAFAHRRLREKPPEGGVSVYRESIAAPPELLDAGARLLEALDWRGVAMVECKLDRAAGRYVLMEVNGRLWGSLQLAIDAGVDFPALLAACALGAAPPRADGYARGVRSRWLWGDLDHLYLRVVRGRGPGPRARALIDFLKFHPVRDREEIFRWRDPGPFTVETLRRLGVLR